jgi:hypothetical protein
MYVCKYVYSCTYAYTHTYVYLQGPSGVCPRANPCAQQLLQRVANLRSSEERIKTQCGLGTWHGPSECHLFQLGRQTHTNLSADRCSIDRFRKVLCTNFTMMSFVCRAEQSGRQSRNNGSQVEFVKPPVSASFRKKR